MTYLTFEIRRQTRNWTLLLFTVLMPVLLYLVFSPDDGGLADVGAISIPGQEYVMIALAGFGAVLGALSISSGVSQERDSGWLAQLRVTPLPPTRVLVARGTISTLIALLVTAAVGAAGVLTQGLSLPADRWALILAVMWLGVAPFALLGLALGYALRPQQAYAASMLAWLGLAFLGGQISTIDDFPAWLQEVSRLTPSYRYGELGWRAIDGTPPSAAGVVILLAWTLVFGALAAWSYRRFAAVR